MLLQLCQKCSAECTHCMVSATKDGKVMDSVTLNNSIKYINLVNPKTLIITGGELQKFQIFNKMINYIYQKIQVPYIILESNGWWLKRENVKEQKFLIKFQELLKLPRIQSLQISSHKDYYPKELYDTVCKYKDEI